MGGFSMGPQNIFIIFSLSFFLRLGYV